MKKIVVVALIAAVSLAIYYKVISNKGANSNSPASYDCKNWDIETVDKPLTKKIFIRSDRGYVLLDPANNVFLSSDGIGVFGFENIVLILLRDQLMISHQQNEKVESLPQALSMMAKATYTNWTISETSGKALVSIDFNPKKDTALPPQLQSYKSLICLSSVGCKLLKLGASAEALQLGSDIHAAIISMRLFSTERINLLEQSCAKILQPSTQEWIQSNIQDLSTSCSIPIVTPSKFSMLCKDFNINLLPILRKYSM